MKTLIRSFSVLALAASLLLAGAGVARAEGDKKAPKDIASFGTLRAATPDVARSFGRPSYSGVVVSEVVSGSPAQRAGLRTGDIILEVDRTPVQKAQALRWKVAQAGLGSTLRVRITRAGHPAVLAITPISMPAKRSARSPRARTTSRSTAPIRTMPSY